MKPIHQASPRVDVPAGFSGWWCERCEKPVALDEELGSPARCPKCHKATAVWIPPAAVVPPERDKGVRALQAGAQWERQRPRDERAKQLFEHMRTVAEHPELNPDLRAIEHEKAIE